MAAEVVAVAAQQWRPALRRGRQLGRSVILAVAGARLDMQQRRGGGGWLHALLAVVAMDSDDNRNCDCLRKKGVEQGIRREGIERWVCFFMLSYFVIVFWLIFFNAGQLISAVVAACCCYHCGENRGSQ